MCESKVYLTSTTDTAEELVMDDVARVLIDGTTITCIDILGERKAVQPARIKQINFIDHSTVLERLED